MDLHTVAGYRVARDRADLALGPGEQLLAGGTWVFSEPQPGCTGLVDLTGLDWPHLEVDGRGGLVIGATCPIAALAGFAPRPGWRAAPLFRQCAEALLQSFKVQTVATVGGNICRAYAAAGMVSLCVALDGVATVWTADGGSDERPVAELVTGNGTNALGPGEVLRSVTLPAYALQARTAFRKIALAALGRSGAVLTGRVDDDGTATFTITAATAAPVVLRYPSLPDEAGLRHDIEAAPGYYTDPLGRADWRRGVSVVLGEEIRAELAAG